MTVSQLYQDLNKEIKDSVAKSEEFYKSLSIQSIPTEDLKGYTIELGTDYNAYNQQLWQYFNARYNDQTRLKKYYFDLEKKLLDKKSILEDQQNQLSSEYDDYKTKNQVAISSIKTDKYELELYQRNNKVMFGIIVGLGFLILVLAINILGLLPNNISLFIGVATILLMILTMGYFWYDDSNRSNTVWNLRNFEISSSNNTGGKCDSIGSVVVSDSQAKEKAKIDSKVQSVISDS
jgi:hypothetical protein